MATHEDRRRVGIRLSVLQYLITVVFSVLAVSFWVLQVVQHAKFEEIAENNHQRTLALRAPRGIVFDRDGAVLVENRHSYSISIVREHTKDLNRTVRLLASVLGIEEPRVREIVDRHRREPSYRPITIVQDATLAQVAAVTARRLDFELPDVVVEEVPTRQYPTDAMAAHLFGYVGEVNETQVAQDDELRRGDIVGQSGIEKTYNALLMGEDGARRVVVNSVGREIRTLEQVEPTEGKRLRLTIDVDVQRAIEEGYRAFGYQGRRRGDGSAERRGARVHQPAGVRPQRVRFRHRPGDLGRSQYRRVPSPDGSGASGPLFARVDVQDDGGVGGAGGRRDHAGLQGPLHRRGRVLRPRVQVLEARRSRHG